MAITRTAMVDDDGTGTTGTIINNAWKQELYNQIDAALPSATSGLWQSVPFSAANFFGSSPLVWTVAVGQLVANNYVVMSRTLFWQMLLVSSTLSGSPASSINIVPPVPYMYRHPPTRVARLTVDGTPIEAEMVAGSASSINIVRCDGGNFPVGSLRLDFSFFSEIA